MRNDFNDEIESPCGGDPFDLDCVEDPETAQGTDETAQGADDSVKPEKHHRGLKVLLVIIGIIVALFAICAIVLTVDDGNRTQTVPEKTLLDGSVNVSGMTRDQLRKTIQQRVDSGYSQTIELTLDAEVYKISLADIGDPDIDATVKAAFEPYDKSFIERCEDRVISLLTGKVARYQISTIRDGDGDKIEQKVEKIAKQVDRDVVNAGYAYDSSKNELVQEKGKAGLTVDVSSTVDAIEAAIAGAAGTIRVDGVVDTVQPKSASTNEKAIYVDTTVCRLYLYDDGKISMTFDCTPGMAGYETPKGDWTISYKDPSPIWVNPHSSWSASMPETIAAGESNPLGLRALALSCGGGVYIHGTINLSQLGSPGSHGCVRLANANILKLYPLVDVGTQVFIR